MMCHFFAIAIFWETHANSYNTKKAWDTAQTFIFTQTMNPAEVQPDLEHLNIPVFLTAEFQQSRQLSTRAVYSFFYSLTPTASSSSDSGLFMIWISKGSTWMPTCWPTGNMSVL